MHDAKALLGAFDLEHESTLTVFPDGAGWERVLGAVLCRGQYEGDVGGHAGSHLILPLGQLQGDRESGRTRDARHTHLGDRGLERASAWAPFLMLRMTDAGTDTLTSICSPASRVATSIPA